MKFTVNKNDIQEVLSKLQGLTGRRSSLAITECIRIFSTENQIHLVATDLETCFEGFFPADIAQEGTLAISARKFFEIVREYPSAEILIEETENRLLTIGNEKVFYRIMGMNADDFPPTPTFEQIQYFEIPAGELKRMIDKSIMISGIGEDKKPHINGVLFERLTESEPFRLRMVSTDGSRLSKYDFSPNEGLAVTSGADVLIPKKGLHEVSKFLSSSGTVQVGIQDSYFIIQSSNETLAIRLLEGQYPRYQDVVFREKGHLIPIEKELFLNMLKRMSILCTDNYKAAIFTFDDNQLVIKATNPDIGESKEDMQIDFSGDKIEAAFNPKYFIDALNMIEDEQIIVDIISEEKPCLVEGAVDKSYLNVIMPMRV